MDGELEAAAGEAFESGEPVIVGYILADTVVTGKEGVLEPVGDTFEAQDAVAVD